MLFSVVSLLVVLVTEVLLYAPNFFVWEGAYINDPQFGLLLEEGTKFKHTRINGNDKYIRIGLIKDWKTKVLSEKKIKIEVKK